MAPDIAISPVVEARPAPGAPADTAQLPVVHQIQDQRTPELDATAIALDTSGQGSLWTGEAKAYRSDVGPLKGWAGTVLLGAAMGVTAAVTGAEKLVLRHQRPYQLDPTVTQLGPVPHGSSDPSGHTSAAYAAATVMGALQPDQAARLAAEANAMAAARIYSGVHFPSDVTAGARLGSAIAQHMVGWLHLGRGAAPVPLPDTSVAGVIGALQAASGAPASVAPVAPANADATVSSGR